MILALIALAILLPFLLARFTPETLGGLVLTGLLSAILLTLAAAAYFFLSYLNANTAILELAGVAPRSTLLYFLELGLGSALIWAPVLVLAISYLPRRWKENVW